MYPLRWSFINNFPLTWNTMVIITKFSNLKQPGILGRNLVMLYYIFLYLWIIRFRVHVYSGVRLIYNFLSLWLHGIVLMSKLWKAKSWEIFHHVFLKFILNLYVVKFIIFYAHLARFIFFSISASKCIDVHWYLKQWLMVLNVFPPSHPYIFLVKVSVQITLLIF